MLYHLSSLDRAPKLALLLRRSFRFTFQFLSFRNRRQDDYPSYPNSYRPIFLAPAIWNCHHRLTAFVYRTRKSTEGRRYGFQHCRSTDDLPVVTGQFRLATLDSHWETHLNSLEISIAFDRFSPNDFWEKCMHTDSPEMSYSGYQVSPVSKPPPSESMPFCRTDFL